MNKIVSVALSLGILLAGGGVFYHYVIFLPAVQANKEALEAKKAEEAEQARVDAQQKEIAKAKIYTACLADAQGNYIHNWNRACKSRNLGTDCSLPTSVARPIDEYRKDQEERCLAEAKAGV